MSEDELKTLKIDKVIDVRGSAYPGPQLTARRSMSTMPKEGIMEVILSNEIAEQDILFWVKVAGHEYLGSIGYPGYCGLFVRKGI